MDSFGIPENPITKDIKLLPGENTVWSGQPDLNLFRSTDWIAAPFSIIWLGGVIFTASIWFKIIPTKDLINIGCIPTIIIFCFLIIGVYNLIGRFIYEYFRKKHTQFVLTNKRAIVICNWLKHAEKSCLLSDISGIKKIVDRNGSGMIIFDDIPDYQVNQWKWSPHLAMRDKTVLFFDIANVDTVYKLCNPLPSDQPQQSIEKSIDSSEQEEWSLPPTVASGLFANYLKPGEKLLWVGQPDMNFRITRKPELIGFIMLLISSPLLALILWIPCRLAFHIQTSVSFPLVWCGSFIFVFLFALMLERPMRKRLHYAVSNQRILELVSAAGQVNFRQVAITSLRNMTKSAYDDGTGSLFFTPPAKAAMFFGPETTLITGFNSVFRQEPIFLCIEKPDAVERLIQEIRQKKGLKDIATETAKHQHMQTFVRAEPDPMIRQRLVPGSLKVRLVLFSQPAAAIWVVALILLVLSCVSIHLLFSCNWTSVLELMGIANPVSALSKNVPLGPQRFFDGPFQAVWAIGVLSMLPIGIRFLIGQLANRKQAIELLKYGERTVGNRLPNERVLLLVNGRPSICERNYEFSVNGQTYQVKSMTGVNQPRAKEVTILFDRQNPDKAVVLDDLPGTPTLSSDGMTVQYSKQSAA